MEYNFRDIEQKWQQRWNDAKAYQVSNISDKPKFYVLDMFPYPSGAGLHVGHPLGYIASDIYSRYKRLKGFNVLHPMGYDAFGLPAEQYAIEHGVHPAVSTSANINNFRKQLDKIGFSYDWDREVNTSKPEYYRWTQWIFLQLFKSFYNRQSQKAEPIVNLIAAFEKEGNANHPIPNSNFQLPVTPSGDGGFTPEQWFAFDEKTKQAILMEYRLAFCGYGEVNWCEALGTVLANDEVVNGVSERGGYPVVKKKLRQWYLRITEYADRLLEGLDRIEFSESMKEMQTNWIGKSYGAEITFPIHTSSPALLPGAEKGAPVQHAHENQTFVPKGAALVPKYNVASFKQFEAARQMRKGHTEAEGILWEALRGDKLGVKFRRQHPIEAYIVDFVCLQEQLILELDGGYHETEEQKVYDAARTTVLEEIGFNVVRFKNEEITGNLQEVLKTIKSYLKAQTEKAAKSYTSSPSLLHGVEKGASAQQGLQHASVEGNNFDQYPVSDPLVEHKKLSFTEAPLAPRGEGPGVRVYTTRPDTIFGVDFMVIAPEHELVSQITTPEQKQAVDEYVAYVNSRSERERQAEKKISGCFTGAYAINPFNGKQIPIWISEYVLAGYGTGAIMAVPCGDDRDFKFAQHFNIPVTNIIGSAFNGEEANPTKDAILEKSEFLDGLVMRDAMQVVNDKIEELGIGKKKVNYRMRDAAFSRQRYWGEPFPIKWQDGVASPLDENELPLELPVVETYGPGPEGEGPLANIPEWVAKELETNTMPGYAGSSWYFLRYMDPHNSETFCERSASDYWNQVDLYIGGTEHAVGHLLYSRLWTKVLFDLGHIGFDEPFKKLVNQGMITGSSRFVYRLIGLVITDPALRKTPPTILISHSFIERLEKDKYYIGTFNEIVWEFLNKRYPDGGIYLQQASYHMLHVDVNIVNGSELDIELFKEWRNGEYANAELILEDGKYICGSEVEKMSKSKFNTVNPDDLVVKFGADTFRMYEMFLGPVEQSKPWDTKGIEGVHRFLKKLWRLFYDELKGLVVTIDAPTAAELKVLHKTIKKIEEDTERFSFNTAVSGFMIAVNELQDLKCHKAAILEPLIVLLVPYAPHIAEELYKALGNHGSVLDAAYPIFEAKHVVESVKEYPISINGKLRTTMDIALDATQPEVETLVYANETVQKWLEGKPVKKFIFVKGKMVNVVI